MIIKFHYLLQNRITIRYPQLRLIHKYIYKMDKAYVRHLTETEQFEFTFHYINPDLKVDRAFNFCRQLSETVDSFLNRISTNVEKTVIKKNKKKKTETGENNIDLNIGLYLNNEDVPKEKICKDVFQAGNQVKLNILNSSYEVIINSPWVKTLELPTSILATYHVYPSKLETGFTNDQDNVFIWYRSKDNKNWSEVSRKYLYVPSEDDVGYFLKLSCIPRNGDTEGPISEVISKTPVTAAPGKCPFEIRHEFTKEHTVGKTLRVVSYNILADLYASMDYTRDVLHPYCAPHALDINYRKQLFIKEVLGYNADIICLQEVDRKIFKHDLSRIFGLFNYGSDLALKGDVAEGLAFFYNKNRFNKIDSRRIVFSEALNTDKLFSNLWEKISKNKQLSERILELATTLQINILESKEFNEILVVANIHLYFHPDADHIRLLQSGLAIKYVENVLNELKEKNSDKRCSLIFCGDFNSVPQCGIYKLYTTGHVSSDCIDFQSNKEEAIDDVELSQSLKLASACGTPQYTNYTVGFADCLDYIYYETDKMEVVKVVPFPSIEELKEHSALPSIVFPSDHIALVSDIRWL